MKIPHLTTLCATMVVGALLIATPMTAIGKTTDQKSPIEDSWLTSKTKIALFADSRVKGRQVNVETKKGVVMIRGKVDTDEAKTAAEEIAKGIDGVKDVKNELQVVAPSAREAVEDKDDAITTRVKSNLKKEPSLKKADIGVKSNAGVVSLTGEVPDIKTSAQASWAAWKTPGVKSVKNDLTVKDKH
jgi:hyperosmotically inducible protein